MSNPTLPPDLLQEEHVTHEPIHYVPVIEQRYAQIIQDLEQHPARNQWSRKGSETVICKSKGSCFQRSSGSSWRHGNCYGC